MKDVIIPKVVGETIEEAKNKLTDMGLEEIKVNRVFSDLPEGTVVSVVPKVNTKIEDNKNIIINISNGKAFGKSEKYIEFVVPNGNKNYHVQIILDNRKGKSVIYDGMQRPGVRIRRKIEVIGRGKVQFLCDDTIVEEKDVWELYRTSYKNL